MKRSARRQQPRSDEAVDQDDQNEPEKNPRRQALQKRRRVLRDRREERIGFTPADHVHQYTKNYQQERRLDGRPADRPQLSQKISHWRAGWGVSPHPSTPD